MPLTPGGWLKEAASFDSLLSKCWHKQKADWLLCQVGRQGEQLAMNAKLIFIARLYSSQGAHWSESSYKSFICRLSIYTPTLTHTHKHVFFILLMSTQSVMALFHIGVCHQSWDEVVLVPSVLLLLLWWAVTARQCVVGRKKCFTYACPQRMNTGLN